tara:strand:- start:12 stop:1478 length:1467 start_codon:yes stop_codon:yes gene_type:complete
MQLNYLANLSHYVPELIVCLTMVMTMVVEATYANGEKSKPLMYWCSIVGLFCAFVVLCLSLGQAPTTAFFNAVVIDPFSTFVKIIMVLGTLGAIWLSHSSTDIYNPVKPEFIMLGLGVLVGGMLLASANNMLTLYLGIETLSILSYALASLRKNDERSSEAGLKYSLYGGISAGLMLFGMSHMFGVLGTIQFSGIAQNIATLSQNEMLVLIPAFLLFFVGIGYKIACVPFHMWSPDVYEGSPIPVTAFFSIVPKMAGIAVLLRITISFFADEGVMQYSWIGLLQVIAALTMTVGNVSAINQRSIKRMLAYSSIGHAGFMMLGAIVLGEEGIRAVLFYGLGYMFMTLAAFAITSFIQNKYGNDHFERFSGLIYRKPMMAIAMAIIMFSLAGIPPFSGFVAKFHILSAIIKEGYMTLAVIAAINSVVSLYYYLKVVRLMIFKPSEDNGEIQGFTFVNQSVIVALVVPVVILGVFWSKIMAVADGAKLFIQ